MTSTRPLTASERYARFVLSAWNRREFSDLQTALTQVPFTRPGNLPAVEYERMDLIQDLGRDLLVWESSAQAEYGTDQNAVLSLVRHLAGCE
jgi:hypothetical protein